MSVIKRQRHARPLGGIASGLLSSAIERTHVACAACDINECPPGREVGLGAVAPGLTAIGSTGKANGCV